MASRTRRLAVVTLVGLAAGVLPACSVNEHRSADGRPREVPVIQPAPGERMIASDYVGGMVFTPPKQRQQPDTTFATVPTDD